MTAAQHKMLFRMFGRLCKLHAWNAQRREMERERITTGALGYLKSWTKFNDSDVDRIKSRLAFELSPSNLAAAREDVAEQEEGAGERKRLLFTIEKDATKAGLSDNYIIDLLRVLKLPDTREWRQLPIEDLTSIRNFVHNRARAKLAKAKKARKPVMPPLRNPYASTARAARTAIRITLERCETVGAVDEPF